ncbi:hypothetical protein [Neisseria sp.]|uniref:hypothetical protein n=1 Tax=Neisseria sp. TaxID=192066 RepID=UPI0035A13060
MAVSPAGGSGVGGYSLGYGLDYEGLIRTYPHRIFRRHTAADTRRLKTVQTQGQRPAVRQL